MTGSWPSQPPDDAQIRDAVYPVLLKCRILELFVILSRYFPQYFSNNVKPGDPYYESSGIKHMQEALRFLEHNYDQAITLSGLAESVNLSRFYLSRLFKRTTGMNFNEYLNRMRVNKAEEILKSTRKAVIDIALSISFSYDLFPFPSYSQ